MLFVFVPFALAFADFINASSIARQSLIAMITLRSYTFRGCHAILSDNAIARYLGNQTAHIGLASCPSENFRAFSVGGGLWVNLCRSFSVNETYSTNFAAGIQCQEKHVANVSIYSYCKFHS
jgi:hypothetical protein